MRLPTLLLFVFLLAANAPVAFASGSVPAACLPDVPHYRYVGPASDAACTDRTIQSAIDNMVCPGTVIMISSRGGDWTGQHLDINNKDLTLMGTSQLCGPPSVCEPGNCPPTPTSPQATISGSGHSGDSVVYIHGNSHVWLKFLEIRDGSNLNGANATYGGGIHFDGNGSLTLETTTVSNNVAMHGGGIQFTGSGGFAGLALLARTLVINNSAGVSGGGIRIDGTAYLSILEDNSLVWHNHSPNGYGGGIHIVGPAHADIGSPGMSGLGVVSSNDAKYGGGVAITSTADGEAVLGLVTVDPARSVQIEQNSASAQGGGLYLKGYAGSISDSPARLCARDFRIDGNAAPDGSAIFAAYDDSPLGLPTGGSIVLNRPSWPHCPAPPAAAVACAAGTRCNTISNNAAIDSAGNPTTGATVSMAESGLFANRFEMRGNKGGYATRSNHSGIDVNSCLLADNRLTRQLVRTESGDDTQLTNCTFAGNEILSTDTIHAESVLTLVNTIIDQPGNLALAYSGSATDLSVQYVLSSDISTLPPAQNVMAGRPIYVDAAQGNYHLAKSSPGLDFAPPITGDDRDLDGRPYDQDLPDVPNVYGPRDLGAYERQLRYCGAGDTVYCDGFEAW